jgi:F-type H+-transporting ATPase subunit delta
MIIATRYSKSLLDLALEKGQLELVYKDMQLVNSVCHENRDFVMMLESPVIKTDKKQEVLQAIFNSKISEVSLAFLNLIAEKRRERTVPQIAESFIDQYKTHKKILTAVITSVGGIDAVIRAKVLDLVKATSDGEVELIEKTDKKLIGGFVLRIGDKQVDASISRKLNDLRKNFIEQPFVNK